MTPFIVACGVPALIALGIVHLSVLWLWRRELGKRDVAPAASELPVAFDRWQIAKGLIATLALIGLFVSPLPREIAALAVAAALLISRRMASREMLARVDWQLLLLFTCLFAITAAFAGTGLAKDGLAWLAERAAASGVRLSFGDFARAGVPMTLASMAVAVLWLGLLGYLPWR